MGNEQSSANDDDLTDAGVTAVSPADRVNLRRQESTHLTQETNDNSGKVRSEAPKEHSPLQVQPDIGKSGSNFSDKTTHLENEKGTGGSLSKNRSSKAFSLHHADSKDGDRRKFYHPAVDTELVGEEEETTEKEQVEDKFTLFVKWMKENGAKFPDQHLVKYTEECRGVHAKTNIPRNSEIAYIPLKLLIHEGHGQNTKIGGKVWNSPNNNIIVPAHTQVIIYMLTNGARNAARGEKCDSFHAPYYRILPENFDCFPIFWSKREMKWLEGSDLVRQIRDRRRNIVADHHEVSRICPEWAEQFSEDDFLWCRTAVGSRNFGININGVKRTTMVPWADMLNHFRPRETSWTFDNSQQGFTMTSLKELSRGQQIMDSYGKKCNSKFLMHYGFAIEKNREEDGKCMNEMPLVFTLENFHEDDDESAELHTRRLSHVSSRMTLRVKMHCDDDATAEALSFCRVAVANQAELDEIDSRGYHGDTLIGPISPRNEIAALSYFATICRERLKRYPTSLAHDLYRLEEEKDLEPFSNERNALIVIKSEKEILHFFIELSQVVTPIFSLPVDDAIRIVQKEYSDESMRSNDIARYLRLVVYDLQGSTDVFGY